MRSPRARALSLFRSFLSLSLARARAITPSLPFLKIRHGGARAALLRSRRSYDGALTDTKPHFIGEATVELETLLIKDEVVKSGEIVGWFPLADPFGLAEGHAFSGRVKLGLKLVNAHKCADCPESAGATPSSGLTPRSTGSPLAVQAGLT